MFDWLFRNRQTGEITVAQAPNLSLSVVLCALVLRWLFRPGGWVGPALGVLAAGALVWWALDEIVRGVNPWRRMLGAAVLTGTAIVVVSR